MRRLATIAAGALLALSLSAPPAAAQGALFRAFQVARTQAQAERTENSAIVRQDGDRNGAGVAQLGRGNRGYVGQRGDDNTATIQQNGNQNTAGVIQRGRGHTANVTQTGDNNGACILQVGRNTTADVVQSGGERTAVLITPAGTRQMREARAARLCGV